MYKNNDERVQGVYYGKKISFKRTWSGYRFSDSEIRQLLDGEDIEIIAISKRTGKPYPVIGSLEKQEYAGREFYGFKADFSKHPVPLRWGDYEFSEIDREDLALGIPVEIKNLVSKAGNTYSITVEFVEGVGLMTVGDPEFDY